MKASIFNILALFRNHLTLTTKLPFLTFFAAKQAAQKNESSQKQSFLIFTFTGSEKSFFLHLLLSLLSIQAEREKGKKERKEEAPRLNLDDNFVEKTWWAGKRMKQKSGQLFSKLYFWLKIGLTFSKSYGDGTPLKVGLLNWVESNKIGKLPYRGSSFVRASFKRPQVTVQL